MAVEAVRRQLIAPERVRTTGVVADGADQAGARPRLARARRRQARAELGLPADATVVGAVGRLTYQKAPEDFLAALRVLGRPGVTGSGSATGNWPGRWRPGRRACRGTR